jgi:hypothetical protein
MQKFTNLKFNVRSFASYSEGIIKLSLYDYEKIINEAIQESMTLVGNEYENLVSEAIHDSMRLAGNEAAILIFNSTGRMYTIHGEIYNAIYESMMFAGIEATMLIFRLTGIMHYIEGDAYCYEELFSRDIHESMMLAGNQATMLIFKLTGIMHTIDGDMYYYEGKGHKSRRVYIKKNGIWLNSNISIKSSFQS